ncbi:MAG: Prolipoprotein diacylglyceryl transferase [Candidatus Anoxychlamydiales bacterium]|nr:Prolipoprotein diacylglyceryl transferase [Candidatus Anoxychlamydiales bacterium]
MFNYIYWDPKKEIFTIPIINYPIVWYSLFFLIGFIIGYYIFVFILKKYFLNFPILFEKDIISNERLLKDLKNPQNYKQKNISDKIKVTKKNILTSLNKFINGDIKNRISIEKAFTKSILSMKKKAILITDKLTIFVVIATILGARLGHILFYENPSYYLNNPSIIFDIRHGLSGLSSHGAAIAILIALYLFKIAIKNYKPKISYLHLLDFIAVPTALCGFFIRIGNFFNQEILGTPTNKFWGVIFAHPADLGPIIPRHPVQLYEAFFYLLTFLILVFLSYKKYFLLRDGKLISVFLIFVFGFRFFIEFFKVKQSDIISDASFLLMGQYLSIPFIVIGILFFIWDYLFKRTS